MILKSGVLDFESSKGLDIRENNFECSCEDKDNSIGMVPELFVFSVQ